ncbi:MAG: hypothetical protein ACI8R4_000727 [Paracoccaceae bacterium]|jgi:hypothetical protein
MPSALFQINRNAAFVAIAMLEQRAVRAVCVAGGKGRNMRVTSPPWGGAP